MASKIPAFSKPILIRFRGIYDFDGLMALMRKFFAEYEFKEIQEPKFKFKLSGAGSEAEFRIKAYRVVSHYIKITLQVDGHGWDIKREPMEIDGKKKIMTGGKIELTINGTVEFDYANMFDSSKAKKGEKLLIEWMHKRLDNDWVGMQFGQNYSDGITFVRSIVNDLSIQIKKHLKMECI